MRSVRDIRGFPTRDCLANRRTRHLCPRVTQRITLSHAADLVFCKEVTWLALNVTKSLYCCQRIPFGVCARRSKSVEDAFEDLCMRRSMRWPFARQIRQVFAVMKTINVASFHASTNPGVVAHTWQVTVTVSIHARVVEKRCAVTSVSASNTKILNT